MFWNRKPKNLRRPSGIEKVRGRLGYVEGQKGLPNMEFMDELAPPEGLWQYRKMRVNDPVIGGIIIQVENIMRQLRWKVTGENSEFIETMLSALPGGLSELNYEMASAFTYGFYIGEEIWRYQDGHMMLIDVQPRFQPTIQKIGDENKMVIQHTHADNYEIPLDKCVHFMIFSESRAPFGVSILRHLYKPYYYKISIEASEMVGFDRDLSGVPIMTAPEGFDFTRTDPESPNYDAESADTLEWALDIVTGIRKDTLTGIVKPHGWVFDIIRGENRTSVPTNETIARYNNEMTVGVLQNFVTLGGFASTNNANVEINVKNFLRACDGYAKAKADAYNKLIEKICRYNQLEPPTLSFYPVNAEELESLASFFTRLVGANVITPTTTLEKELLDIAGFPYNPEAAKPMPE
jgi:hypothetical protein